jgi:protein-S-isoprenylcysteine O-methyltransferase Ste14
VITALWGVLVVVFSVLIAVAALNLVNRLIPTTLREDHNDVAGFIYAVVGVVYAVLLAFVVIAVWQNYEAARDTTVREADELAEIFFLAHRFPEPERTRIQELARSYARVIVDEEWPLMAEGRSSPRAWETLDDLRAAVQAYEPRTETEQVLYGEELDRLNGLGDARRDRLIEAQMGIPAILWFVLVLGGVITVGFTFLFGLRSNLAHTLMVAALTALLAMVLFTIGALEYPFSGSVRLPPSAFELVLDRFDTSDLSTFR